MVFFRVASGISAVALALASASCGYQLATSRNPRLESRDLRTIYIAPVRNDSFKSGAENVLYNELVRMITSSRALRLARSPEEADAVLRSTVRLAASIAGNPANAATLDVKDDFGNSVFGASQLKQVEGVLVATQYIAVLDTSFRLERAMSEDERRAAITIPAPVATATPRPPGTNTAPPGEESGLPSGGSGSIVSDPAPLAIGDPVAAPLSRAGRAEVPSGGDVNPPGAPPGWKVIWLQDFSRQRPFPSSNQLGVFGTTAALINDSEFDRALKENAAAVANDLFESMLAVF